jgi:arabinofuranosyltransferase
VPNTAIAKLNLEVERLVLVKAGLLYLVDSLTADPITLVAIVAGASLAVRLGDRASRALMLGALLYLGYVVSIGGDFMSGRFLVAPFVAALCVIARALFEESPEKLVFILASAYCALWPWTPIHSGWSYGADYREGLELNGVIDERAYYYPKTGLLPVLRARDATKTVPPYSGACLGRELARSSRAGQLTGEVGLFGYFAEDKVVIDLFALADPLLSRIPYRTARFRAGHYVRPIPPGYVETRLTGKNVLEDPALRVAWKDLELVTRGTPLLSPERLAAIRALASGAHREAFERAAALPRTMITPPDPGPCELE